jgi:hypothetical protein
VCPGYNADRRKKGKMEAIKISKLDAARRQLETAIDLFFENGDPAYCLGTYLISR